MKRLLFLMGILVFMTGALVSAQAPPETITLAGTIQSVLGCEGDWQPECEVTHMLYNEDADLWAATFELPAGNYEVKVAYNGSWTTNFGMNGEEGGANIPFTVAEDGTFVDFVYSESDNILNISANGESLVGGAEQSGDDSGGGASVTQPGIVNIPGTIQNVLGCPGEWAPDCEATFLTFNEAAGLWIGTFDVPAGEYEYKVALNGSWDVNFGGASDPGGPNIVLTVPEDQSITFIYDHSTNLIVDSVRNTLATAIGDFQDELGCESDFQADCFNTLLTDGDGDGLASATFKDLPAGDYTIAVAVGFSDEEVYAETTFTVENEGDPVILSYNSANNTLVVVTGGAVVLISSSDLTRSRGHWVTEDTLLWDNALEEGESYALLHSPDASFRVDVLGLLGTYELIELSVADAISDDVLVKFPHLDGYTALTLPEEAVERVPELLRAQNFLVKVNAEGTISAVTGVQLAGVLDDLYTYDGELGVIIEDGVPTLKVWAPTAQNVNLILFGEDEDQTLQMERDDFGVWSITGDESWMNAYYQYEVTVYAPSVREIVVNEVTDPYSISLSMNSIRSQIVDLNDPQWMPNGWLDYEKPTLERAEDIVLYELHIRDFSIFDETVPADYRGTYKAFTVADSNGMTHLKGLADAGLTHIHLLPAFDIATVIESRERQFTPDYEAMSALPPDSEEQQAILDEIRDLDGYNWGYDPYHYNVPEGSYSTDPNSPQRLLEFREMVMALNNAGLRVVMDVVYNHTTASGQARRSVLDKVVPGYYHRLDANGAIARSTCCENTATEHNMMRKLMVDSVVLFSTAYKIDGYRFDLMGHHMLSDMIELRDALDSLTVESDGVDGSKIYVYGEGWDFGEVQDNARGINATQLNIAGTGIGVFNDRLRDAARGGSPFGGFTEQGFINGLYTNQNGLTPGDDETQLARLLLFSDQIRVGLAGSLADYTFTNAEGETVTGADIDYNGEPAGYTAMPRENINYVSAHDNETLWDAITFKAPKGTSMADRVRMQNMGISLVGLSQGVPFFHAGSDMLRSKSLDRNSYNSSDWFNRLDFSYQTNNFGVGLPPAGDNRDNWDIMQPLLADESLKPTTEDILMNVNHMREILQIRKSTPLFRLDSAEAVQERLSFLNTGADQIPGVIVMMLSDVTGADLDPNHDAVVVIFNASNETVEFPLADDMQMSFELHPVQVNSVDSIVQGASYADGVFSVPAMTTAVFVVSQ